ncbi:MAG: P83/100 family protein, partial [Treponemataceae bacterium]|nr:P83/100 family protein [Treponemataceae bacterium]
QTERSEIATDQQKNIADAKAEAKMVTTYGLQLVDNSNLLSKLVFLDVETGKIVKSSPVQVIRNRSIVSTGNGFAAIAGETAGENQAIRLVILDPENLEIVSQTEEDVAPNAVLVSADN